MDLEHANAKGVPIYYTEPNPIAQFLYATGDAFTSVAHLGEGLVTALSPKAHGETGAEERGAALQPLAAAAEKERRRISESKLVDERAPNQISAVPAMHELQRISSKEPDSPNALRAAHEQRTLHGAAEAAVQEEQVRQIIELAEHEKAMELVQKQKAKTPPAHLTAERTQLSTLDRHAIYSLSHDSTADTLHVFTIAFSHCLALQVVKDVRTYGLASAELLVTAP